MTTKITEADLDDALKAKLDATGSYIVAPGNVAKFGDTTGIATLTVADVLALREQIRQASNAAELAVSSLESASDVLAFTW